MAIQTYENFVLENKMTDLVNTNLDVNALFTVDNSLATEAGLDKVVNKYTYDGAVEQLAKGAKNTTIGNVTFVPTKYTVKRYQQTFKYNDMDVMQDPYILDVATTGAATVMANEIKAEYIDELKKISNTHGVGEHITYDGVVDALAAIGREVESDTFIVMGLADRADIRKDADYRHPDRVKSSILVSLVLLQVFLACSPSSFLTMSSTSLQKTRLSSSLRRKVLLSRIETLRLKTTPLFMRDTV